MRRIVVCLVILAVLASSFFYEPLKAQGDCYVPSEYATIQAAADDVGCTTIHVAPGAYNEPLVNIDRGMTLMGAGANSTMLNGRIDVHDASPVTISGFTIANPVSDTCAIFFDHSDGDASDNDIFSYYGICYENGSGSVERNYIESNVGVVYYPDLMDGPTTITASVRDNEIHGNLAGVAVAFASGTVERNDISAMVGVAAIAGDLAVRNNPDISSLAGVLYILSKGRIEGNAIDAEIGVASALSCTLGSFDITGPDYSFQCTAGSVDTSDNEIYSEAGIAYIASVGSIDGNAIEGDMLGIASVLSGLVSSFSYNEGTGTMTLAFSSGDVAITENQVTGDGGLAGILDVYGLGDIKDNYVTGYTGSPTPFGSMGFGILTAVVPEMNIASPHQSLTSSLLAVPGGEGDTSLASRLDDALSKIMEALHIGEFQIPSLSEVENLSLGENGHIALTQALQQGEAGINIEGNTVVGNETGIEVVGFPAPIEIPFEEFPITITRNLTSGNELHGIEAYFAIVGSPLNSLMEARRGGDTHAVLSATALQQGDGFPLVITDNVSTLNGLDGISYFWPFEGYIINNTSSFNTEDGIDLTGLEQCVVMNNIATSNGTAPGDAGIEVDAAPPVEDYNDVWGNFENYIGLATGPNDISQDPLFASPTGDLHLLCASPAVDAGNNAAPEIPMIDFDAESRIQGGIVDMGAFEGCALKRRPTALPSLLPTAVNHISEGNNLLKQAEDLLTQAKESGKDMAQCEKMVEEARKLLKEAGNTLTVPIVANNKALAGIAKLKQAIECLKALLG